MPTKQESSSMIWFCITAMFKLQRKQNLQPTTQTVTLSYIHWFSGKRIHLFYFSFHRHYHHDIIISHSNSLSATSIRSKLKIRFNKRILADCHFNTLYSTGEEHENGHFENLSPPKDRVRKHKQNINFRYALFV